MRSVRRVFEMKREEEPLLSTFVIFSKTVEKRRFSEDIIRRWFNTLVDKEDYESCDKKALIQYLVKRSNS